MLNNLAERAFSKTRIFYLRHIRSRVSIGSKCGITGPLVIRGEGDVRVGNRVRFDTATGRPNRLLTFAAGAKISIGNDCYLNGVEIACATEVCIGDHTIIAEALILDTDFHSVEIDRHSPDAVVRKGPVTIGSNVWIANKAIILRGIIIGDNSVIGAGSVVTRDVPPNVVVAGNPARVIRQLIAKDAIEKGVG